MTRIVRWTAAAVIVTALFATLYLVMQQSERQGADDAPGRLASQVAAQLSDSGAAPQTENQGAGSSSDTVDLAVSDAEFYVVYDAANRPVSGTGRLDGALAAIPTGVLDVARHAGVDHVTWQTSDGRRFATVERRVGDAVVVAAQSLAPSENRTDQIGALILIAWACTLAVVLVAFFIERGVAEPLPKRFAPT
jgi:hypothetical protein